MYSQFSRVSIACKAMAMAGLMAAAAFAGQASGTVKDAKGAALAGVTVSVQGAVVATQATTAADGSFTITTGVTGIQMKSVVNPAFTIKHVDGALLIQCPGEGAVSLDLVEVNGKNLWSATAILSQGAARVDVPAGIHFNAAFLRARHGADFLYMPVLKDDASGWKVATHLVSARSLATLPTLVFSKAGFAEATYVMKTETETGIAITMAESVGGDFVEDHRKECTIPAMPAVSALTNITNLPDPFKMMDGTAVTTKAQWTCRREEIAAMLEKYVHGEKPRNPEKVEGSFAGGKLNVKVTDKGKSINFDVTITKPSGTGPFPAIIGWDGGNIAGGYSGLNVAKISYPITTIAAEGSGRGKGKFYDLYGSNAAASELMAHAWGLSRIIDALLVTPEAGIDAKHLAVTGCSRWGKSSSISGSFDQRVQLVIPQESGSGGVAAWRVIPSFSAAQPIKSTYDEQFWTRQDFWQNFGSSINKLPVDHHEMIGMIAPRGLLVLDNSIDWLGPEVGWASANAAKEIYKALGAEEGITYSSVGGHDHCSLPASQNHWVKSYVQKYLMGGTGEAAKMEAPAAYKFDRAKWITWTTPILK
ncbi:MAG: carboxypeptidase regulatory-like domain-containing protein [Fibrobacterota bacterium]|nr:MAG: carboxypeptidase regulatory-like domain-containing protein [Fibrobacterota bacterium]